jgi:hypothetical protein
MNVEIPALLTLDLTKTLRHHTPEKFLDQWHAFKKGATSQHWISTSNSTEQEQQKALNSFSRKIQEHMSNQTITQRIVTDQRLQQRCKPYHAPDRISGLPNIEERP